MNSNTIRTLIFCTLSIFFLSITACHHHNEKRYFGHGGGKAGLTNYIVKELDLDSAQEDQLIGILTIFEEKKEGQSKHDELKNIFMEHLKNKELDEEYLRQKTTVYISELKGASNKFITDLTSFHASLNEKQKIELVNFLNKKNRLSHRIN
ncbi:MAG: hypothetical protein GY797_20345 [Deltaproteobacteria bacterium]|nr:hypothetical protein [Deltaproteobacteria bacterium]